MGTINTLIKSTEVELNSIRNLRKMAMNQVHLSQVIIDQSVKEDRSLRQHLKALVDTRNHNTKALEEAQNVNLKNDVGVYVETGLGKSPKPKVVRKHKVLRFKANAARRVKGFPLRGVQRAIYEVQHNEAKDKLSFAEYTSVLKKHMQRRHLPDDVVERAEQTLLQKGILKLQGGYYSLA